LAAKIRLLIVDDVAETRANLCKLLLLEDHIEVVGEAGNGEEALQLAKELKPDVVLMDINMPVMDGILATERMTVELPQIAIIILSVQGEGEYLRKAMAAGARDYLTKPPGSDELLQTIQRVYELEKKRHQSLSAFAQKPSRKPGKIISVFSTKGGVGKSLITVNLAVAMQQISGKKTAIVDLDLQFGDVTMLMDLLPRRTISDLTSEPDQLDIKTIESYLLEHSSGVKVLPAPLRPEFAEAIHGKNIEQILRVLKEHYDYILIDTCQSFDDITLSALDISDTILIVTTLDVLTIKNVKLGLEAMASLHYESSKIKLILNRSTSEMGLSISDLENSLKYPVTNALPSDGKVAVMSCNKGVPFVLSDPKAPITEAIQDLARELMEMPPQKKEKPAHSSWRSMIRR
jgi:pilus assembly protein CpaE